MDISAKGYGHTEVRCFYLARDADEVLDIGVPIGYTHDISQMHVSGVVQESNGKPAANATVTLVNAYNTSESQQARTDAKGKYKFNEIQIGDYILYVTKPNFYANATTFRLYNGEHYKANIELKSAPEFNILSKRKN